MAEHCEVVCSSNYMAWYGKGRSVRHWMQWRRRRAWFSAPGARPWVGGGASTSHWAFEILLFFMCCCWWGPVILHSASNYVWFTAMSNILQPCWNFDLSVFLHRKKKLNFYFPFWVDLILKTDLWFRVWAKEVGRGCGNVASAPYENFHTKTLPLLE